MRSLAWQDWLVSGRSEFVQAVFGITPADTGTIEIEGEVVSIRSPIDAKKLGIAYVPEDRGIQGLVRPMRLSENISMAALKDLSNGPFLNRSSEKDLALESVGKFGIRTSGIEQIVSKLSGGNQQKIVLAKWLATKPRILIMDEPTRGIDVGAKAEIHRLMSELAQTGLAVIMISSELPEILGMSDRILVMREGKIAAEFTRHDATQEKIARAMTSMAEAA